METVRKKISLYSCKSHVTGGLPYIDEESGLTNFGKFVYDIGSDCSLYNQITALTDTLVTDNSFIRTCNLMNRYNVLLDVLRKSLHLQKLKDKNDCDTGETQIFIDVYDDITTYDFIMNSTVVDYFDIELVKTGTYIYSDTCNTDFLIGVSNFEKFNELGGIELVKLVDSLIIRDISGETINLEEPLIPYVSIPVLITLDTDEMGILTPYEDEWEDFTYRSGELSPIYSSTSIEVESKLQTLKYGNNTMDDDGNILPGILSDSDKNSLINRVVPDIKLLLPYSVGTILNKDNGICDIITDIVDDRQGKITFSYIIGASINNDSVDYGTGIHYEETYNIEYNLTGITNLYGIENILYKYDSIKYSDNEVVVYSKDFNLDRNTAKGNITAYTVGDVWRTDGSVLDTPLIKEEYLIGTSFDSNIDVDVTIDRGNAAAFEKHLKLFECNSYDDIENYGNSSFFK